jgi:hypothetical protein
MNGRLIMRLVFQFISDALIFRGLTYRAAAILVKMRKAIANWAWIRGPTSTNASYWVDKSSESEHRICAQSRGDVNTSVALAPHRTNHFHQPHSSQPLSRSNLHNLIPSTLHPPKRAESLLASHQHGPPQAHAQRPREG